MTEKLCRHTILLNVTKMVIFHLYLHFEVHFLNYRVNNVLFSRNVSCRHFPIFSERKSQIKNIETVDRDILLTLVQLG